jgi:hypothetical protein
MPMALLVVPVKQPLLSLAVVVGLSDKKENQNIPPQANY